MSQLKSMLGTIDPGQREARLSSPDVTGKDSPRRYGGTRLVDQPAMDASPHTPEAADVEFSLVTGDPLHHAQRVIGLIPARVELPHHKTCVDETQNA